jgi:hypothetical protein
MDDEYDIFKAAHEADFAPLIELLRSGAELTADRRALVIKILQGKIKRPNHRQASLKTLKRRSAIFDRVHELEIDGWKSTAAIRQVQEEFKCSESTVRKACRPYRGEWEQTFEFLNRIKSLDARKRKVVGCALSLMVAEQKRAVGFADDDPDKYPSEILAEARYFAGLVKSQNRKEEAEKSPDLITYAFSST